MKSSPTTKMTNKKLLLKALDGLNQNFNQDAQLLLLPVDSPGYHTTLTDLDWAHDTRASLVYSVALLDSEIPHYAERAFSVIKKVIDLQDTDPEHNTYGIWPWYEEEPLTQMSPPDWNWADFCGKQLLLAIIRHKNRMPEPLAEQVKMSIFHACNAIIKRNVGPDYTNIAIMGAFVTLIAGEFFEHEPYREYGLERLNRFYRYTKRLNTLEEYNSPCYTPIAIQELSSIHTETSTEKAKKICEQLLDLAWRMVAEHYHANTKQWAGPHSRTYSTLLTLSDLSFLQLATDGSVPFLSEEELFYDTLWFGNNIQCPEPILPVFVNDEERSIRVQIESIETTGKERWATAYMNPDFSLSTFDKDVMWNQRRNLISYIKNGGNSTYVHLRCLRNGYDYSSAIFTSAQEHEKVLFGINFAIDGGNTHISLDPINGIVEAEDLRLRFEIGGCLDQIRLMETLEPDHTGDIHIRIADTVMTVRLLYAVFDRELPKWEFTRTEDNICLDLVMYSGPAKKFNFNEINRAAFVIGFGMGQPIHIDGTVSESDEQVGTVWTSEGHLSLSIPLKPDQKEKVMRKNRTSLEPIER